MALYNWRKIREERAPFPEVLKTEWGFNMAVARGEFEDVMHIHKFGHNASVGASNDTIWPLSGTNIIFRTAEVAMTLSSNNAADAAGGTGAQSVQIDGIDGNFNMKSEVFDTDGVNGVAIGNWLGVHRMMCLRPGTGLVNAGIIYVGTGTITTGKPAVVDNLIAADHGQTTSAFYTIPSGWTGYLKLLTVDSAVVKQILARLQVREQDQCWHIRDVLPFADNSIDSPWPINMVLRSRSYVEAQAFATGAGGDVGAEFIIQLERDD